MYDFVAALSFLPLEPPRWVASDQRSELAAKKGLSRTTMDLLDALAALTVSEPDDIYAMALTLPPQPLTLYVSNGGAVPTAATEHLQAIWSFLRTAHEPVSQPAEPTSRHDSQFRALVALQMRYSWGCVVAVPN
ncbi:hypothetical protein EXIGLDRAFT_762847 [Exidia glandulosa HHB12029]|uniref:Uncharacterized protein n=1 Tax=Exidia glandulosa HHB12029 TaxID=1314781 RepID=A0A165MCQ0_EXIGL|nr:hypothetical protein EXIGLDRAFT_762847 [Exidia glandulosa HHB12029]